MATIGAFVTHVLAGGVAMLIFVLCLPRIILRRVRGWSNRRKEEGRTSVSYQHNSEVPPPPWVTHEQGIAEIKIETVEDHESGQIGLMSSTALISTGSDELSEITVDPPLVSTATTTSTSGFLTEQQPVIEAASWGVVPDFEEPKATPLSPFVAGVPGLEVPNPVPQEPHVNAPLSRDLSSPPLMQQSPWVAGKNGCPLSPGAARPDAVRQRPKGAIRPSGELSFHRSRSAPTAPVDLEPPSEQESEGQIDNGLKDGAPESTGRSECRSAVLSSLRCAVSADIGQRRTMEDYYVVAMRKDISNRKSPSIEACVGIFDGHNGPEAAKYSSENLVEFLLEAYTEDCGVAAALQDAFRTCEDALLGQWRGGLFGESGTTALVCVILSDDQMHIANVGDSRAVLSRSGRAEALTKDHRPGSCDERARILDSGGFLDSEDYLNGEIGVSRAFGDFHLDSIKNPEGSGPLISDPDVYSIALNNECEFVVLASDGLWDHISNQRAVDITRDELNETQSAEKAAEKLVFEAKCKGSRDNITVSVVALQQLPLPVRKSARKRFINSRLRLNSKSLMDLKEALQSAENDMPQPF